MQPLLSHVLGPIPRPRLIHPTAAEHETRGGARGPSSNPHEKSRLLATVTGEIKEKAVRILYACVQVLGPLKKKLGDAWGPAEESMGMEYNVRLRWSPEDPSLGELVSAPMSKYLPPAEEPRSKSTRAAAEATMYVYTARNATPSTSSSGTTASRAECEEDTVVQAAVVAPLLDAIDSAADEAEGELELQALPTGDAHGGQESEVRTRCALSLAMGDPAVASARD